jgi:hypothetical protein
MQSVSKRKRGVVYVGAACAACCWAALGGLLFSQPALPELALHRPPLRPAYTVRDKVEKRPVLTPPMTAEATAPERASESLPSADSPRSAAVPESAKQRAPRLRRSAAAPLKQGVSHGGWQPHRVEYSPYLATPATQKTSPSDSTQRALDTMQLR